MTISQEPSAPLVVVVGITGNQGGSVARALIESDKPYRIRGLTRDVTKPAAQAFGKQGVELYRVLLTVDNAENARKAFEGADIAFGITNAVEHFDYDRELAEGKLMVDIAKAVGVKLFVWSGLESITSLSGGKYSMPTFDTKAAVTAYAKQSGVPLSVVQAGGYASGYLDPFISSYKKQPDGSYVFTLPVSGSTKVPIIDIHHDYGTYVRAAIESPALGPGSEVLTGQIISLEDLVQQLGEVTGKKITYSVIDRVAYIESIPMKPLGLMLANMYQSIEANGYYGPKAVTSVDLLAKKPRSWMDVLKATPKDKFPF